MVMDTNWWYALTTDKRWRLPM